MRLIWDLVIRDVKSGSEERPLPSGQLYEAGRWSPDSRYLTVIEIRSNTDQDILLLDSRSGEFSTITPHEGEVNFFPGPWKADSSGFYIVSNQGREFLGLAFYDLAAQAWSWIETPDHDLEQLVLSKDGRVLVWSLNEGGMSRLYGRNLETGAMLTIPTLPQGVISGLAIAPDGSRLALILNRAVEASNLYELTLATGTVDVLGQSMLGGIDPADMVEPQLIEYPTFDGRKIPAWLFKPKNISGRIPVVLSIHGGPEAQERPLYIYDGMYQYWLHRGFAVLAPNIRGSTGYGISYQKLIHRDFGGDELKDIEHAAKYLQSLDWVDKNRIVVFGGSFGGFRDAQRRDAPARLLGAGGRCRRAIQSGDVCQGGAAFLEALHESLGGRPG